MSDSSVAAEGETDAAKSKRYQIKFAKLRETFTPSRPVQTREIFSGRQDQLLECLHILNQAGTHGILHGERGVGKTSIANIVQIVADSLNIHFDAATEVPRTVALKIECTSTDTFRSIIAQVCQKIPVERSARRTIGFTRLKETQTRPSDLFSALPKNHSYNPKFVAQLFGKLPLRLLIILDEFDRLNHSRFSLSDCTEFMKIVSDTNVDAHLLIVGVGDDVNSILGNHQSIARNLVQIKLNMMTPPEIRQIVETGARANDITFPDKIIEQIVDFSCGYPHYTHLLCLFAGENALAREGNSIEQLDLEVAISKSISRANESLRSSYQAATMANKQNIYKEVLQACGKVDLDEYGTFQPKDVEKPLSAILKRPMKASQFGAHLIKLCSEPRGAILCSRGEKGRIRYRFRDPLMRAFVKLNTASRRTD